MRIARLLAAGGIVVSLIAATRPPAIAEPGRLGAAAPATDHSVTLLSGDQIAVYGSKPEQATMSVRPAPGRERLVFPSYVEGGHLFVIPSDAQRLVASGQLDRRLFDVTLLINDQYDDAHRSSLPVIVTYQDAAPATLAAAAITQNLPSINGAAIDADTANPTLWSALTGHAARASGVRKVWLDGKRTASLDRSVPQIGAPAAWAAGATGAGVKIAVLDTGVDQTHPDLASQEVAEKNFTDTPDNVDRVGHGTHVASIAAGTGAKSGGKFKGVAFGAQVLDGKVLDDFGTGRESWIIAGMQWAAEQGAKVANLSLGGQDTPDLDAVEEAVNNLSAQFGVLYVIAAGNDGPGGETIGSPGSADAALTVGAVDRADNLAPFSSRGPRVGDGAIKPDVTGPGVGIVAAKAANGIIGSPAADGYVSLSGTSMATPHVTGSVALLAQLHPTWSGAQLKAALTASAKPNPALGAFEQGSGRIDVDKAIAQTITSEPTNLSLGTARWPHDDDQPVTKPLMYHNSSGTDVTLDLALSARGPDGRAAPDGVFSLSAKRITLPAGGSAQVNLTGNTKAGTIDGAYSGTIVATSGTASAVTPFGISREAESYDLTINVRDLSGAPTTDYLVQIIGLDDDSIRRPFEPDGTLKVRLPKGRYYVDTQLQHFASPDTIDHLSLVERPNLMLNQDTTIDSLASAAKPVRVSTPDPTARLLDASISFATRIRRGTFTWVVFVRDLDQVSTAGLGPALPPETMTSLVNTQWTAPSGAFYGLAWFQQGTMPTGFIKSVRQRDLAKVEADLGSVTPDRPNGVLFAVPQPARGVMLAFGIARPVPLPSRQTELFNTDGTRWSTTLLQFGPDARGIEARLTSESQAFKAGSTEHIRFNHAPFGPAFPKSDLPWASRTGDTLDVALPLFSDSAGNNGSSIVDSATTRLFRDGVLVGATNHLAIGVEVPPQVSDYRLTTEAVRPDIFDVTTKISAAWTFRSGHVDSGELASLPLAAVRFTPKLDANNSAPAGRPFLVPVTLQLQSATVQPSRLTVDVSYDEGKTWQPAKVLANQAVLLLHPPNATTVSLRAKTSDRNGNTAEQTIIRAYKLN